MWGLPVCGELGSEQFRCSGFLRFLHTFLDFSSVFAQENQSIPSKAFKILFRKCAGGGSALRGLGLAGAGLIGVLGGSWVVISGL